MSRVGKKNTCDADLVSRSQAGDSAAFSELVARYQDRVYNTCYRMCHNHDDALDLTQTAFMRAYQALPRFEIRARFYTWLFRIAVNLAYTLRRTRRRRPALSLSQLAGQDGGEFEPPGRCDDDGPGRHAAVDELRERVELALERLDDEFRAAVVLRDVEGMDYTEIAEILDVPVGTVKSRIYRGRMMLRKMLKDEEPQLGVG